MTTSTSKTNPPTEVEAEVVAPLSKVEETLLVNFANDVSGQAGRLDDLAKLLITLFIAVPSVFAAILKLISGDKAVLTHPAITIIAFVFWLGALEFSLISLIPRRCEIDPDSLNEIQKYFSDSARSKYILISIACALSFLGISFAVFSIL